MAAFNKNDWEKLVAEWVNDPQLLYTDFKADYAAAPYVKEIPASDRTALPPPAQVAYDSALGQWQTDVATNGAAFEVIMDTPVSAPDSEVITANELYDALDRVEWGILDPLLQEEIKLLLNMGEGIIIDEDSKAREVLLASFPNGSATRTKLLTVISGKTQSYSSSLGLRKVTVGHFDRLTREYS